MTLYTENSQNLQRSCWWANIKFIKVAEDKINTNWIHTPAMNNPKWKLRKHAYLLNCFSCVQLFAILWTISHVHGILWERILEWVAMPPLQGIFLTQGLKPSVLYPLHCRWILYHYCHLGSPIPCIIASKRTKYQRKTFNQGGKYLYLENYKNVIILTTESN